MRLADLATKVPGARVAHGPDVEVRGITYDSRKVQRGDLFVAIRGAVHDGAAFATEAVARGAVAVAAQRRLDLPSSVGLLLAPDARRALGDLGNAVLGAPSERLRLIGVTGTDGKTTTCQLIAHVLAAAGRRVGWLTTVDLRIGDEVYPTPFERTTPESSELHETLAQFVEAGIEDAVIEVSSHALALDRVQGCSFDAAVFTNLSSEHLNFHGTVEEYAATKARLFEMLATPTSKKFSRMGVVNADDPASVLMAASSPAGIVSYAIDQIADVTATRLELGLTGTRFRLVTPVGEADVETRLIGRHNVSNWLAAAAVALGWGIELDAVVEAAAKAEPAPGRLQRVRCGQPFEVIVDFAHTPQAMGAILSILRPLCEGQFLLAFGMAGGRDSANRPRMGELIARAADFFVLTTDDPVAEEPRAIAAQIEDGARAAGAVVGADYVVELDRRAAIRALLQRARPGDIVLIAGKGHERRMLLADRVEPWNDGEVAAELLVELGYG